MGFHLENGGALLVFSAISNSFRKELQRANTIDTRIYAYSASKKAATTTSKGNISQHSQTFEFTNTSPIIKSKSVKVGFPTVIEISRLGGGALPPIICMPGTLQTSYKTSRNRGHT